MAMHSNVHSGRRRFVQGGLAASAGLLVGLVVVVVDVVRRSTVEKP